MSSTQPNPVKHRGTTENASKSNKTQSQSNENDDPARIELMDGSVIDAQHYIINSDGWVCVYTGARSDGIDYRIPNSSVHWIDTTEETVTEVINDE